MKLVVSLHDVHPSSLSAVARQRADLKAIGIRRFSLLVVPNWHREEPVESAPEFVATVSRWAAEGDEIVLHGWTHTCAGLRERPADLFWTRLYTSWEAEFRIATVEETRARLTTGRALFEQLGWPVVGFIAPAWLYAAHTFGLLQELGFAYATTRKAILPLGSRSKPLTSTSLCYSTRSGWRRASSFFWNGSLERSLRRKPLMRLGLHPGDIEVPFLWAQIQRLCRRALAQGRMSATYRDVVADSGALRPLPRLTSLRPDAQTS